MIPAMNKRLCDPAEEKHLEEQFPWRTLSPEEYAARHSHLIGTFSLDRCTYSNRDFDQWISTLGPIFRSSLKAGECRRKFLTPAERASIENFPGEISRNPELF